MVRLRRGSSSLVLAALLVATASPPPVEAAPAGAEPAKGPVARVIVQQVDPADPAARAAVQALGGRVTESLPIVDGFAAEIPAGAAATLAAVAGVRTVTPDAAVEVQGSIEGGAEGSIVPRVVRAEELWRRGPTGRGVTVALIDTGVADVPDLAGRIVPVQQPLSLGTAPCVNLSGEAGCGDSYGHGTFMAGLIAGNGASTGGRPTGVAPEAKVLSLKVAGRDGSADVSNVLAAIQWVVSYRDRYDIRVLNLSLGTDSTQSYQVDPLNYAVERAWAAGIVVVVSASNRGPGPGTIAKPGDDPWVITVGAIDDVGTVGVGDDRLPLFSALGPTAADGLPKPDVTAPGANVVSLRSPGSEIDTRFPPGTAGASRRGSGTSMAAAVVSGSAALLLQADPAMTPNRLKFALMATSRRAASTDPMAVGAGLIDVEAALAAPPGQANAGLLRSTGRGSLDASRGTVRVSVNNLGSVLGATHTAQLLLWDPVGYTTGNWSAASYPLTTWYLSGWGATRWNGNNWNGNNWNGNNWNGNNWNGNNWNGSTWFGQFDPASTYGSNWNGSTWYGLWGG